MELELKKDSFEAYETGGEVTLTQEETTETIVPDYCPDIGRIVETEGKIFLHSRELREGSGEVTGTVRISVLYLPEGESGIRVLEFAMPFSMESDHRTLADCTSLTAEVETEFLETRMLNPRKLFTHCKLVCHMTGYQRTPVCFCSDVTAEPELCVEKRQEEQHAIFLTHIAEKDFTFSDEMTLPSGRDGAVELLTSRACSTVTDTKVVGNKLIFKGIFTVGVLYRTEAGRCCTASAELPFSQIMEVEGVSEAALATVDLQLTGCDLQLGDDHEGRQIAVTLYFHATAMLREERELGLLCDLYSTTYQTTYEAEPLSLVSYRQTLERREAVRETLEIGVVADSILALTATCGTVSVSREGEQVTLRTGVSVRAMYQDEGGSPLAAERCMDVTCRLELPEECRVTARAVCPEEIQGSLTDRGIEVRFQVLFCIEAATRVKRVCISKAELDPDTPRDTAGAPSLVLRSLGSGESAWDLAKTYHTTIATILAANQLEREEDLPREKLLLIPRKRA